MRRHGGLVIMIGVVSLVLVGAVLRRWEPVAVAMPVFVSYGIICLVHSFKGPDITIERFLDTDAIYPGLEVEVTLEITNNRGMGVGLLEVFDMLPKSVEVVKGKNHRVFSLGAHEVKEISYKVVFHLLGDGRIGPVKWRSQDHMSFFFNEGVSDALTPITVRRVMEDVRRLNIHPPMAHRPFGQIPARVKGTGSEFYGLREYVPSDPLRNVNWKASARRDKLISKEFQDERLGDVVLIVDLRPAFKVGEGAENTVDATLNGALAMAQRVLQQRNRLSIVYLRSGVGWISGITSRRHLKQIVDKGDLPKELETYPINWLPWIVKMSFPTKAYLIAFTTLLDDDMTTMIRDVALSGYDILTVSPSPASTCIEFYPGPETDQALTLSRRLVMLRRRNRIQKLSKIMQVVNWDFSEPLALTLRRIERHRGGARWRGRSISARA